MMSHRLFAIAVLTLLLAAEGALRASAQLPAAITGSVVDERGKGLAGVQVTATSTTASDSRHAITTSRGGFRLSGLPPGVYRVEFELAGYRRHVRTGIVLNVGFTANLNNLRLEPGAGPAIVAAGPPSAPTTAGSAPPPVANVQSRAENVQPTVNGTDVTITYDLSGPPARGPSAVRLLVSLDAGTTFDFVPKSVTGDVGDKVTIGAGKVIRWKAARDVERGDLSALRFRVIVE